MVTALAALPSGLPQNLPALSTDAIIIAATFLVIAYSLIAGHAALVREAISVYVGIVLAASFGGPAYDYLSHSAGSNWPVSETEIRLILLVLPIVLLQFGRHRVVHVHHNVVATVVLAVFTAMLAVSSVLQQLDSVTLAHLTDQSNFAAFADHFRLVWLAAVPLAVAADALFRARSHHRH